ncbi:glycerol transporter [Batrachochytrium dendrobatidis]|nr:glycerol transporter [Batrachochytrium dendrobatidis]
MDISATPLLPRGVQPETNANRNSLNSSARVERHDNDHHVRVTHPSSRHSQQHHSLLSLEPPIIYVVIGLLILVVIYWAQMAVSFSDEMSKNYPMFIRKLSPGWIFHRKVDNSDAQFRSFRNNIPALSLVLVVHQAMSVFLGVRFNSGPNAGHRRMHFTLWFSVVFLTILLGVEMIKLVAVCLIQYVVVKQFGATWVSPVFSWCMGLMILFGGAVVDFKFEYVFSWLSWMDKLKGLGMSPAYNFTMLRMISFTTDYYWQRLESVKQFEKHKIDCMTCFNGESTSAFRCSKGRIYASHHVSEYSLINYMTYLLYAPLFLAGPIICFNDFVAQIHSPPKEVTLKRIGVAALRWAGIVLLMELFIHYMYVVAIKDTEAWTGFTSVEIYALGYWNLNHIWLKLTIIWRFFGLWALADGVETVDNMARCMSNQYSGIQFWRAWHRSYNRWVVRYLYIPLGGNKRYLLNLIATFTFVAIWHDVKLKLLAWGWLIALFILPEMILTRLLCNAKWRTILGSMHLQMCAVGGVCNILTMMLANLVGFAVGLKGMQEFMYQIMHGKALVFFISVIPGLFLIVHVAFWWEARQKQRVE